MKKISILLYSAILFTTFSGCSYWRDFNVYFNTYYNAKDAFELAERSYKNQKKDPFEFYEQNPDGNLNSNLTKTIEKCSKIIQNNPNSRFADNSIMLIGECLYYQTGYIRAKRKFNELLTQYPNSDLVVKAKFWLGKTELRLKNDEAGINILYEVLQQATKDDDKQLATLVYTELVKFYLYKNDIAKLVENAKMLIQFTDEDMVAANASYLLANTYLKLEDNDNALRYFKNIDLYNVAPEVLFNSKIEIIKIYDKMGKTQLATTLLLKMRSDPRMSANYSIIDYEIANTKYRAKNYEAAYNDYTVIDTTYKNTAQAGLANYKKGYIQENIYKQLDSALVYYKLASKMPVPKEIADTILIKIDNFSKYRGLVNDIALIKQAIYLKSIEPTIDTSKINKLVVKDSTKNTKDSVANKANTLVPAKIISKEIKNDVEDEVDNRLMTKSAISNNRGDRKSVPDDIEIRSGLNAVDKSTNLQQNSTKDTVKKSVTMDPKLLAYKALKPDSLKNLLADKYFDLSFHMSDNLKMQDSLVYYQEYIWKNFEGTRIYPINLYLLANRYEKSNKPFADSIFKHIYRKYPNSNIANYVAKKIGEEAYIASTDSSANYFRKAENTFLANNYSAAINEFCNIIKKFPSSDFSAKSVYTIGWIYENKLNLRDSAFTFYKKLEILYPNTIYHNKIKKRLINYTDFKNNKISDTCLASVEIKEPNKDTIKANLALKDKEKAEINQQNRPADFTEEMGKFDGRTVLERRKRRTIW